MPRFFAWVVAVGLSGCGAANTPATRASELDAADPAPALEPMPLALDARLVALVAATPAALCALVDDALRESGDQCGSEFMSPQCEVGTTHGVVVELTVHESCMGVDTTRDFLAFQTARGVVVGAQIGHHEDGHGPSPDDVFYSVESVSADRARALITARSEREAGAGTFVRTIECAIEPQVRCGLRPL